MSSLAVLLAGYSAVKATPRTEIPAAPTAVGVVDLERLIGQLAEVQAQNEGLKKRATELQGQIEEIKKSRDAAKAEFDLAAANDPKKLEKRFRVEALSLQLEAHMKGLGTVLGVEKGRYVRQLYGRISTAAQGLAAQAGFDLILLDDRSLALPESENLTDSQLNQVIQNKNVIFAADSIDLTNQLAQQMNNQFNAGGTKK
jgi:Skp family chaperone for outer membrane proteins